MSKEWAKAQASKQRRIEELRRARQAPQTAEREEQAEKVRRILTRFVQQEAKVNRLAQAFADRAFRVHELMGQLRAEWERAEAAEARVKELEKKLAAQ